MTKRARLASFLLFASLAATPARADVPGGPRQVVVCATRVHLGDLVANADATAAAIDLGPSPAAGVSRLITRADIIAALAARIATVPAGLPDAVRVLRKVKHLAPEDLDAVVREALATRTLGRGVTLASVRADRAQDVAAGWTRVEVEAPRAPKKVGPFTTTAIVSMFAGDEVVARLLVPIDLAVSDEGATFDAPRGASLTLVIRRTFVEVRAAGFAAADADVGDPVNVQLRPSGRLVRARLVSRDEALAVEAGR
jgi:Chaperone for flagella basal body P-ring formation